MKIELVHSSSLWYHFESPTEHEGNINSEASEILILLTWDGTYILFLFFWLLVVVVVLLVFLSSSGLRTLTLGSLYRQWFSECGLLNLAAPAFPRGLFEMWIIGPHTRASEWKAQGETRQSVFSSPPDDSKAWYSLRITDLR